MTHPAFANIPNNEIQAALSEPFVTVDTHVVFNDFEKVPAEHVTPLAVGVLAVYEGQLAFMSGLSVQTATPLNHVSDYLDEYGRTLRRAHGPVFEDRPDEGLEFKLIDVLQSNIRRVVAEDDLRVLAGFMLGVTSNPQMTVTGFIVARKALDTLDRGIVRGFSDAEDAFDMAANEEEAVTEDKPTRESLIDTVRELLLPTAVGRLLPKPVVVSNAFKEYPGINDFYAKSSKAQRKALIAERRAAANFN